MNGFHLFSLVILCDHSDKNIAEGIAEVGLYYLKRYKFILYFILVFPLRESNNRDWIQCTGCQLSFWIKNLPM